MRSQKVSETKKLPSTGVTFPFDWQQKPFTAQFWKSFFAHYRLLKLCRSFCEGISITEIVSAIVLQK